MNKKDFLPLIKLAFREDLADRGDVTSDAIFSREKARAVLLSKDNGILAGAMVFSSVFSYVDKQTSVLFSFRDGDMLSKGDNVAVIDGKVTSILKAERTALNFISLLSGIATKTAGFVKAARSAGKAEILDTRKTIPGFRALSKYAVHTGGGTNHRMGLHDMVLIKDNHIDAAGGITEAIRRVKAKWHHQYRIEVECRTLADVEEALSCDIDVIMLDNMDPGRIREACALVNRRVKTEASGQMNIDMVREISNSGVDYISAGCLTKSVEAFDFSLDIQMKGKTDV